MKPKFCCNCDDQLTTGDFLPVLNELTLNTDLELHVITALVADNDILCTQCDVGSKNHFSMLSHYAGECVSL